MNTTLKHEVTTAFKGEKRSAPNGSQKTYMHPDSMSFSAWNPLNLPYLDRKFEQSSRWNYTTVKVLHMKV